MYMTHEMIYLLHSLFDTQVGLVEAQKRFLGKVSIYAKLFQNPHVSFHWVILWTGMLSLVRAIVVDIDTDVAICCLPFPTHSIPDTKKFFLVPKPL